MNDRLRHLVEILLRLLKVWPSEELHARRRRMRRRRRRAAQGK